MIADLWVYELGDVILLTLSRDVKDTVMAKLDQFIFTEDVQLGDVTETFAALAVVGPDAAAAVASALGVDVESLAALPEHGNMRASFNGQPAIVLGVTDLGEPGYDVLVESTLLPTLRNTLHSSGAVEVDAATAEMLRVESGVPKFHRDMDEETIPLEAGIESRAISLTKGCYVGQEVIIRVLHRGHGRVARKLVGIVIDEGSTPDRGADVQSGDRRVGEVTSAAWSPALNRPIALAYLQRDFIAPGTRVSIAGHPAEVTALPFVR
jgi:folate-binding protein YgfZ